MIAHDHTRTELRKVSAAKIHGLEAAIRAFTGVVAPGIEIMLTADSVVADAEAESVRNGRRSRAHLVQR